MATPPRFPRDEEKRPELVPHPPRPLSGRQDKLRFAILAAISAVLLLSVIFYYVRRGPGKAAAPSSDVLLEQPNNNELHVDNIQISAGSSSEAVTFAGHVTNTGSRILNGAQVRLAFRDRKGTTIATVDRPMGGLASGNCEVANEFVKHPIKPNDLRFFCVSVSPAPNDWNHEPPEAQVLTVTTPQ